MRSFLRSLTGFSLLIGFVVLDGCYPRADPEPNDHSEGYIPIYKSYADVRNVQVMAARALKRPGKIYIKDAYLFVNEVEEGIHVFDNRDPAHPVALSFISIPGNYDVAVKDSTLYANNTMDLVALNIGNPKAIRIVKRIENAFPAITYPVERNVWFECADPARGVVVGWQKSSLNNPRCYR